MGKMGGRPRASRTPTVPRADLRSMEEGGVHDFVTATLEEMGICAAPMRTILIQEGYFVGYKYRFDGGYAVWLVEKNVIEVHDNAGKLLNTVSLVETEKNSAA
jgi:hypothetical protein